MTLCGMNAEDDKDFPNRKDRMETQLEGHALDGDAALINSMHPPAKDGRDSEKVPAGAKVGSHPPPAHKKGRHHDRN